MEREIRGERKAVRGVLGPSPYSEFRGCTTMLEICQLTSISEINKAEELLPNESACEVR